MSSSINVHWRSVATEWEYFGSPLRPCDKDIQFMEQVVAEKCNDKNNIKVQLCGVTPEIATMDWPAGTYLEAIEQSQEMIDVIWPGNIEARRMAVKGDWLDGSLNIKTNDIVIGDGCFISVDYPNNYKALAQTLAGTLKENGLLVMRFFTQIEEKESSDQVFGELLTGKIDSFHAFKWRLAMSLQKSTQQGVLLHDIYMAWEQAEIDKEKLLVETGWSQKAIDTISLYKNKQNCFSFATLAEVLEVFDNYFYKESIYFPKYELGERCPIIVFRPR